MPEEEKEDGYLISCLDISSFDEWNKIS